MVSHLYDPAFGYDLGLRLIRVALARQMRLAQFDDRMDNGSHCECSAKNDDLKKCGP